MHRKLTRILALAIAAVMLFTACSKQEEKEDEEKTGLGGLKIGYADEGVTTVEDPDALQKEVDEMVEAAKDNEITLEYKNDASSTDGENFDCYIANAVENKYDMFVGIFADPNMEDELFVSQLLRPGSAFETIKLNHPLERGTHEVYVFFTQVEEDLETIHGQIPVTMSFTVK